jgi:hypothetical protein
MQSLYSPMRTRPRSPGTPPNTAMPGCEAKFAIASTKYVMVNSANTSNTGRLRVSAATVMYAVKMPHANKNIPTAAGMAAAGIFAALNVTRKRERDPESAVRGGRSCLQTLLFFRHLKSTKPTSRPRGTMVRMNLSLWLERAEIDWNTEVHQVGCRGRPPRNTAKKAGGANEKSNRSNGNHNLSQTF